MGGFAGVAVDGLALLEKLEAKLEEHPGQLLRASVELAKMWRQVRQETVCEVAIQCTSRTFNVLFTTLAFSLSLPSVQLAKMWRQVRQGTVCEVAIRMWPAVYMVGFVSVLSSVELAKLWRQVRQRILGLLARLQLLHLVCCAFGAGQVASRRTCTGNGVQLPGDTSPGSTLQ